MMMTEKYFTLPPPSSSSPSFCYSTIYHSPKTNRIRDIKNRLNSQKKLPTILHESNNMKLLIEQPIIRTYSLYDIQERIDYFEKKKTFDNEIKIKCKEKILSNPSSTDDTLQSVIANTLQQTFLKNESYGSAISRTMMNSAVTATGKRRSFSSSQINSLNDQKRSQRYCSLLSKRVRTYSLTNHSTMAITAMTSFSEEQTTEPQETTSIDYENTYFYPEETTRLDDILSLTTITPNNQQKIIHTQQDLDICSDTTVSQSDTEDHSEEIISTIKQYNGDTYQINIESNLQNENIKNNNHNQIIQVRLNLTPSEHDFTGVVHAKKCTIIKEKECLSDYDNVNHYCEQNKMIRSKADNVSLNKSMTLSIEEEKEEEEDHCRRISTDEQLNQQEKRTNHHHHPNDFINVNQQQAMVHSIKMKNDNYDDDDDDDIGGHYSDESNYSDDLRYSSDAARNSCASDDLNNTSSTLRQEAISITRVRCKRRKTWIRSPSSPIQSSINNIKSNSYIQQHRLKTNLIQPFLTTNRIAGMDARPSTSVNSTTTRKTATSIILNQTRAKATTAVAAMLLHNNSLNSKKNGESLPYEFIPSNNIDHQSITNHESLLLKTNNTFDKDTLSSKTNKKINDFYQPSLSPVKRLLNESIDSNIEVIQMDEQECILEIVDGILTIVPKEKSMSASASSSSIDEQQNHQFNNKIDSLELKKQRSSSIASSISTPSLSEQEHEQERDDLSPQFSSKPFIHTHDKPLSPHLPIEQSVDILDLFSTPINPINSNTKTLLDDSLSSVSSYGEHQIEKIKKQPSTSIPRSSSPINQKTKSSTITDTSTSTIEDQTRSNKNTLLTQLLQTVKKTSSNDEIEIDKTKSDYSIPKISTLPIPKPINKDRINEFASLLSSSVHLSQSQIITKKPLISTQKTRSSPIRSDEQSFSSVPSASSTDRDERESYHTVKSNNSEQELTKRHIDARYNEKLDDRGSIKIKTANIKALFEQKISDTNKALSQSTEHLLHLTEIRQQQQQPQQSHRKIPISYGSLKKNYYNQTVSNNINRRKSYQDSLVMNKYTDHIPGTKDVVIEDKQFENGHINNIRRSTISDPIISPTVDSLANSPVSITNGYYSESLIAREIRETKEKEDELKRQRKKCGLEDDGSILLTQSMNDSIKSESTVQPTKNSSFLSNLDFFTSKLNGSSTTELTSPRHSIISTQNLIYDQQNSSSKPANDELKQINNVVSQELHRFNDNGIPIIRTSSINNLLQRSISNQNILSTQNTHNIIQQEIEAIRAKEAELRQLGRIQHTSDEHADPRKYQELVSILPKSQTIHNVSNGKIRRDSENQYLSRHNGLINTTTNGLLKSKTPISSIRGKFSSTNPLAPIVSSSNKSMDYSKLSSTDRLELEKRQCQEREQELRKQRHSISVSTSSTNTTINGDSGNVSQEEHDDDQERYFDKIQRLKRTENEKAQAPLIRPIKKLDMSQKWEQMMANKIDD